MLREDLYFRLNTIVLTLPPLREREGDIALLAVRFIVQFASRHRRHVNGIEPQALRALERHPWPGNVRELEHVIERAVILCTGSDIRLDDLPDMVRHPMMLPRHASMPIGQPLHEIERLAIVQTLERTRATSARPRRCSGSTGRRSTTSCADTVCGTPTRSWRPMRRSSRAVPGAQQLGHAPRLGDAAARRVRRLGVEDLADRSDARLIEVRHDSRLEKRRARRRDRPGGRAATRRRTGRSSQGQTVPW